MMNISAFLNLINVNSLLKSILDRLSWSGDGEKIVTLHSSARERQRIVEGVRRFFNENYELRYNVLKQTEEYRRKEPITLREEALVAQQEPFNSEKEAPVWQQLSDRELRKMAIEQMEQVGAAWSVDVELYVRSALIPAYDPVRDFLDGCGTWDGHTDHIRDYARRVPTGFDRWPDCFHRWMLAMVAQWLNLSRDFGNAVVPMLIGTQGTHKSTFCRLLLPPCLREKDVQTRKMRSDQYVLLPRMASFIATTNDVEPLTDSTGSRRYLCCEVTGIIDTDTPIDYRGMYAQAVTELQSGARWHFTKDEEAHIERHNTAYRRQSSPETVLLSYFEPASRSKDCFMRAVDIQQELRRHVKGTDVPNIKTLTMALKSCHFMHGAMNGVRGWYARQIF